MASSFTSSTDATNTTDATSSANATNTTDATNCTIYVKVYGKSGHASVVMYNADSLTQVQANVSKLEAVCKKGCELSVNIVNCKTGKFHIYEFDYLTTSESLPRKWILGNLLYSISCKDTGDERDELIDVFSALHAEYERC
jgi:hypothetical protein